MYQRLNISKQTREYVEECEAKLSDVFKITQDIANENQMKVLDAFHQCGVSTRHFNQTTGYGYGDDGRDTLDALFAKSLGAQDALVRSHYVSATHALTSAFFGLLRPKERLLAITGSPYDTLIPAIGWNEDCSGSLKEWGVKYSEIQLTNDGEIDILRVLDSLTSDVKVVFIQRSRGYAWRPAMSIEKIKQTVKAIKNVRQDVYIMIDNCYGEFVETIEPTHVGADVIVGSLIKNPGGGIAPTGAYIAGEKECVEMIAARLTSPGIGREVGCNPSGYLPYYQGLFMAPHVVSQSIKIAQLFAQVMKGRGYSVLPEVNEKRTDIIQAVAFNNEELLIKFCQSIQCAAPVDAHALPLPWDMPGYADQVIMAAGTFVSGASIELSADAPIRKPYIAYFQGGLTYEHGRIAAMVALESIKTQ